VEHKEEKMDVHETQNPPKKPYAAPSLVHYGSVAKLTQTSGTESLADMTLTMRMPGGCL
jgi:hypothetical protein